jgi:hypothetical protein
MDIETLEKQAAEKVAAFAESNAWTYSGNEDLDAATVALLWEAFSQQAKKFGLTNWRGLEL